MLSRKADHVGGGVNRFSTRTTKLSQACHNCGKYKKKSLKVRWHDCGIFAQRDLYPAFLAIFVEQDENGRDILNAERAKSVWSEYEAILQAAIRNIKTASGRRLPSSFGKTQSQSSLLANLSVSVVESKGVVTFQNIGTLELSIACGET